MICFAMSSLKDFSSKAGTYTLWYPEKVETFSFNPHIGALKIGAPIEYKGWKNIERIN